MTKKKICIVEDDSDLREALGLMIQYTQDYQVSGSFKNSDEALENIPILSPDAVLMDINLPGESGITCVRKIKSKLPQVLILMCTSYEDEDKITGKVRMRIIIFYDGINYSTCVNFDFGQVEDYTLNITSGTLSADDIDSKKDFVYPNPTKDYFYYSKDYKKLEVMSIDGRVLMTNSNTSKINLSNRSVRVYMIKVYNSDNSIRTSKIIKK